MSKLVNITAAVADVERAKLGERWRVVDGYIKGRADYTTADGKQLLHRRALFLTELRVRKVWAG